MEKKAGLDLEKEENIPTSRTIAPSLGGQLWGARLPWEVLYSASALPASWEAKGSRAPVGQSEVQRKGHSSAWVL